MNGFENDEWLRKHEATEDELVRQELRIVNAHAVLQDEVDLHTRNDDLFDASLASFDQVYTATALEDMPLARYSLESAVTLANADLDSMDLPNVEGVDRQIKIPSFVKRGAGVYENIGQRLIEASQILAPPVFDTFHPYAANCRRLIKAVDILEVNLQQEPYSEEQAKLIQYTASSAYNVSKGTELINKKARLLQLLKLAQQAADYHEPGVSNTCDEAAFYTYQFVLSICDRTGSKHAAPIMYDAAEKLLLLVHSSPAYAYSDEIIRKNRLYVFWHLDQLQKVRGIDAQEVESKKAELIDIVLPDEKLLVSKMKSRR